MTDLTTPKDHSIIVPVDFSETSENAMDYAVAMAKLFDNQIILVNAISANSLSSIFTGTDTKKLIEDGIASKMQQYVETIMNIWPQARVSTHVEEGKPYKVITKLAEDTNADAIVMGVNGANRMERFIGSTTMRVMSHAHIPVIGVKEKKSAPTFRDIVMPIDLTKTSKQKVAWAAKLAQKFNSTVHVIMEVEKDEFLKNKVNANLNQVEQFLAKNGVKYVAKLLDDRKYPEHIGMDTIQYAEEVGADLIIVMTQQEAGSLSQFFMGNYFQQVVNSSQKTPVMSVNPLKTTKFEGSEGFY